MRRPHAPGTPPIKLEVDATLKALAALGDRAKLTMLFLLELGEREEGELFNNSGVDREAGTYHVGRLRASGLVDARRDGRDLTYCISNFGRIALAVFRQLQHR